MFESIITSALLMYKKDGHLTLDWIIMILPFLLPYIFEWVKIAWQHISKYLNKPKNIVQPTFVYKASTEVIGWNVNSIVASFCVVMWDWYKKNKLVGIKGLVEIGTGSWYGGSQNTATFVNDSGIQFWHKDRPHIRYIMYLETINQSSNPTSLNTNTRVCLIINFYSDEANQNMAAEHIEFLRQEASHIQEQIQRKQSIYISRNLKDGIIEYDAYKFNTTTSFANFFSEHAVNVKKALDFFIENKNFYEKSGRPYNFTVLNHGEPGCGKTKLVKAIAAYTGRSIVVLNLQHLTDPEALAKSFFSTQIGSENVKHSDRIYYIPELDTDSNSFLRKRETHSGKKGVSKKSKQKPDEDEDDILPAYYTAGFDGYTDYKTEQDSVNLGILLNILDGIPERHNQIIIMDTNHIEKLDPAIFRPGRVDIVMKWEKATGKSIKDMLIANYGTDGTDGSDVSNEEWMNLPTGKFTPATIMTMTLTHKTLRSCYDALMAH